MTPKNGRNEASFFRILKNDSENFGQEDAFDFKLVNMKNYKSLGNYMKNIYKNWLNSWLDVKSQNFPPV